MKMWKWQNGDIGMGIGCIVGEWRHWNGRMKAWIRRVGIKDGTRRIDV